MTKHAQHVVPIVPGTLEAVIDQQPGPGKQHAFYVQVDVEVEVDWKVSLVEAHPPGINPRSKLLRFHVEVPHGAHSNAIAKRTLRYEEKPPKAEYDAVTVEDGRDTTSAKVAIVV